MATVLRLRRLWDVASRMPRWLRLSAAVLLVAGASTATYYQFEYRPEAQKRLRISEQWMNFDRAAKSGDEADLIQALDEILRLNPDDNLARQRKGSLESGSADESDPVMPLLTLPKHLQAERWPEAEREARKRLAHQPKDWLARCTVAKVALLRGDRAGANREINQLPDPQDGFSHTSPASLLFAFDLFRELDRDATPLRQFVREAVVESARSSAAESFPVSIKVQMVECYLEGFEPKTDRPQPSGLSRAVLAVGKLIDLALGDAAIDSGNALKLGLCCNRLVPAFTLLAREGQITPAQYPTIAKDHESRTVRAWESLIARNPKAVAAYQGMATVALRANDFPKAYRHVIRGLESCGDNAALLALYSLLLRAEDQLPLALERLLVAAEKDPKNISLWVLLAETAEAAGRRDIAIEACEKARALEPKNPWAIRTEARINIEAGDAYTHTGVQLLATLGDRLTADPGAARLYVRGLIDAGLGLLVEDFLKKVEAESLKRRSPALIAQALRGITDSRYDPALAELALRQCKLLLEHFPRDTELLAVQAFCFFRTAEQGEPRWNETATNGTLRAFEELQNHAPDNLEIAAAMAWARLKGKREQARALRDSGVLIAAIDQGLPLTPWQWQVLGAVYQANGKQDYAIRCLEKARRNSKETAGVYIHLALAYQSLGNKAAARDALERARTLPRSTQEQADYLDAFAILQREKS